MDPLVSQEWLAARLEEPRLRIVDCRFTLGDPGAGRAAYAAGHIPGAAFLDLDADLSAPPGAPDPQRPTGPLGGRHPLPDLDAFAAAARAVGIGSGTTVVAYDDAMSGGAARLWWLLRHCGFDDAAVLDGGLAAWEGPLRTGGEPPRAAGDFAPARVREDDLVGAEQIAAELERDPRERTLQLLDARAPERFRGEHEPIDPVAGHIPGARNLPLADAFPPPSGRTDGTATADLTDLLGDLGPRTPVATCGSGVSATALVLALTVAGRDDVKLYAGSWSDWVARGLPIARGDVPRERAE